MTANIEQIIKKNAFLAITGSAKASVLAQVSKMPDMSANYLSERGRDAATRLSCVSLSHARMPGFFKPGEGADIIEFAAGNTQQAPASFEAVTRRSSVLSTLSDKGTGPGAKMIIGYSVPSGETQLDQAGQSKMAVVTSLLNRALDDYRTSFAKHREIEALGREALNHPETRKTYDAAVMKMVMAEQEVIANTEIYMYARNDLASYNFDVSNFDKNAEKNSLLILAVRRYELDPARESNFTIGQKPAAKRDSIQMSM